MASECMIAAFGIGGGGPDQLEWSLARARDLYGGLVGISGIVLYVVTGRLQVARACLTVLPYYAYYGSCRACCAYLAP